VKYLINSLQFTITYKNTAHCIADFSADIIKITIHLATMGFNDAGQLECIRNVATEFRPFCTYAMIVIEHTEVKDPDTERICVEGRSEGEGDA
jgi:hypothetical protein